MHPSSFARILHRAAEHGHPTTHAMKSLIWLNQVNALKEGPRRRSICTGIDSWLNCTFVGGEWVERWFVLCWCQLQTQSTQRDHAQRPLLVSSTRYFLHNAAHWVFSLFENIVRKLLRSHEIPSGLAVGNTRTKYVQSHFSAFFFPFWCSLWTLNTPTRWNALSRCVCVLVCVCARVYVLLHLLLCRCVWVYVRERQRERRSYWFNLFHRDKHLFSFSFSVGLNFYFKLPLPEQV